MTDHKNCFDFCGLDFNRYEIIPRSISKVFLVRIISTALCSVIERRTVTFDQVRESSIRWIYHPTQQQTVEVINKVFQSRVTRLHATTNDSIIGSSLLWTSIICRPSIVNEKIRLCVSCVEVHALFSSRTVLDWPSIDTPYDGSYVLCCQWSSYWKSEHGSFKRRSIAYVW